MSLSLMNRLNEIESAVFKLPKISSDYSGNRTLEDLSKQFQL